MVALAAGSVVAVLLVRRYQQPPGVPLGLRPAGQVDLPGGGSRFDYASLDAARGLLFLAHLGAGEVVEVDVRARRVVRVIDGLPGVHGVLVVPAKHRLFATAADTNTMVILDEDTGARLGSGPTGAYPDGLAFDPVHNTVWTTNESGGTETVLDADTAAVVGRVNLGGEVGNVVYDPSGRQPDVLAFDPDPGRLYVASESGWLSILTEHGRRLSVTGSGHLADGAHVVAVDPRTHRSFYPVPSSPDGRPALLAFDAP